jgi:hypothetical protein
MNNSQKKIVVIACFVFSPIFMIIGLFGESAFVGLILPIASIFAGLFFKNSNTNIKKEITYEEYFSIMFPLILKEIANGAVDAVSEELKKQENTKHITEDELRKFITNNFDADSIKFDYIDMLRKTYTYEEFQYVANHVLTPLGLKIAEKSSVAMKEMMKILKPELDRVCQLIDEKFDLYD